MYCSRVITVGSLPSMLTLQTRDVCRARDLQLSKHLGQLRRAQVLRGVCFKCSAVGAWVPVRS